MKKIKLKLRKNSLSLFLIICFFLNVLAVDINQQAQEMYLKSMAALGQDNEPQALDLFEKALFKDSKILAFDDKGLLDKITTKYLKKVTEEPKVEYYYKLGFLMRVRGNYKESINFFSDGIKRFPDNEKYVNYAKKKIYELQWLITGEKPKSEDEKTPVDNFVVATPDKNQNEDKQKDPDKSIEEKQPKQDQKKAADEKLKQSISSAESEVAQLQNEYDLWFSLNYNDKYEKKDYYPAMMYFYEDKLKAAKEKLKKLQEQMDN
ncbi:MAG: hypothetical protein C0601_13385 [Candidatus Muiribacterium halophilum]|uniref:Uncharacterized protein n=1 Tax=Muiribacterium halophilum TaxID=2053465 RepID=A0A2N5Z9L5_MUIH1|nr:MAG: hypothetical protein C0601_13385 [Candidatus Muirbacterium halophilum]